MLVDNMGGAPLCHFPPLNDNDIAVKHNPHTEPLPQVQLPPFTVINARLLCSTCTNQAYYTGGITFSPPEHAILAPEGWPAARAKRFEQANYPCGASFVICKFFTTNNF